MGQVVKKNADFLRLVLSTPSRVQRSSLLKTVTPDQLLALGTIATNLLQGSIPFTPNYKRKLKRHRVAIRIIANKKVSVKKRKQALQPKVVLLLLQAVDPILRTVLK